MTNFLTQKYGPLPAWGWGAGVGGVVLVFLLVSKKKNAPAPDTTSNAGATKIATPPSVVNNTFGGGTVGFINPPKHTGNTDKHHHKKETPPPPVDTQPIPPAPIPPVSPLQQALEDATRASTIAYNNLNASKLPVATYDSQGHMEYSYSGNSDTPVLKQIFNDAVAKVNAAKLAIANANGVYMDPNA